MKPLVSFSSMLRAELYKTLRNGRILMILLSPLAIYLLLFFYVTYKGREGLFNYTMPVYEGDPWLMLWSRYTLPFFSLIIPIAVVTLSYLICEIEFQNDNIRALFAHPIAKWKLYLSKTSVLSLLIAIFSILIWLCFVLGGYLLELLIPAYPFGAYAVWGPSIAVWGRAIPAMLLIGVFGLIVSLLSRNFTLPVLLALFFTVLAVFTSNEPAGIYNAYLFGISPYGGGAYCLFGKRRHKPIALRYLALYRLPMLYPRKEIVTSQPHSLTSSRKVSV